MGRNMLPLVCLLILSGCLHRPPKVTYTNSKTGKTVKKRLPYNNLQDYPSIRKEKNANKLVDDIAQRNCVLSAYVGVGGSYNITYARFERLCIISSENELLDLTLHENSAVKAYALIALRKEHSSLLDSVISILGQDTSKVCFQMGCVVSEQTMAEFVASMPKDSSQSP